MPIFISSKFKQGVKCEYKGVELEYGMDAFNSLQEAADQNGALMEVVFLDAKVELTDKDRQLLLNGANVVSSTADYVDGMWQIGEMMDFVDMPEYDWYNIKAANTLVARDWNVIEPMGPISVNNYLTVTLDNVNDKTASFGKDNYYTVTEKKVAGPQMDMEWFQKTRTYKHDGSITVTDSAINSIQEYLTVNLTNSSAGAIIRSSLSKLVYNTDESNMPMSPIIETYTANGTLNIKADAKATATEYNIGDVDSLLLHDAGAISGYKTVNISGYTAKKAGENDVTININGDINGGDRVNTREDMAADPDVVENSSGAITLSDNVNVAGDIEGFTNVTLKNDVAVGDIEKGDDKSKVVETKKSKKVSYDWGDETVNTYIYTTTYTKDGSVNATDAVINGDIENYKSVTLTNSSAGAISRDMLTKKVESWLVDAEMDTGERPEYLPSESAEYTYASDGTLNIKADAKATAQVYNIGTADGDAYPGEGDYPDYDMPYPDYDMDTPVVGDDNAAISGYKTVNISGYTAKKAGENSVAININGDINGGEGDVEKEIMENMEPGWDEFWASSGAITLSDNVTLNGDINDFTAVNLKNNVIVTGGIYNGDDKETERETSKTVTKTDSSNEKYTEDIETEVTTYAKNGTVTIADSEVRGNIKDYKTVTLTNSSAGNITRNTLTQEVEESISSMYLGDSEYTTLTYTADGTLNIKADAKATETEYNIGNDDVNAAPGAGDYPGYDMPYTDYGMDTPVVDTGAISGYKTVNISGYTAKKSAEIDKEININGDIKGGDRVEQIDMSYGGFTIETETTSSGAITLSDNVNVDGAIEGFTNVTLKNNIEVGDIAKGNDKSKVVETKKSKKVSYDWGDVTENKYIYTTTYTKDGSVNATDAVIDGDIENYKSVTLTNSSAGEISRNTLVKKVEEYDFPKDTDMAAEPLNAEYTYTADGTLNIKADAKATETEYNIGNADVNTDPDYDMPYSDYDMDAPGVGDDNAAISGYKTVNISGYTAKKGTENDVTINIDGDIKGGDKVVKNGMNFGGIPIETETSSGAITLSDNVNLDGDIEGFTNVTLKNNIEVGDIEKGDDKSKVVETKKSKKVSYEWGDETVNTYIYTTTYTKDGSVNATNAVINGDIENYKSVTLTNSSAGVISRDALVKEVEEYEYSIDAGMAAYPVSTEYTYTADGTLNIKTDVKATEIEYNIGNDGSLNSEAAAISGYKTVNISGYTAKKGTGNDVTININGDIEGGDRVEQIDMNFGGIPIETETSSGAITLSDNVTVTGDIEGFTNVTLKNNIEVGDIEKGDDKFKTAETKKKEVITIPEWQEKITRDVYTYTTTYTKDGSVNATDAVINGDIENYKSVTLTNSSAGVISRDALAKFVDVQISEDGFMQNRASAELTYTADGTLNVKADAKATETVYEIGLDEDQVNGEVDTWRQLPGVNAAEPCPVYYNKKAAISGYKTVNISGYTAKKDTEDDVAININGNIKGGDVVYGYDALESVDWMKTETSSGAITLSDNVTLEGAIEGFTNVTLKNNIEVGDIAKGNDKSSVRESKKVVNNSESSYTEYTTTTTYTKDGSVNATDAVINGDIENYKSVTLTNSSAGAISRDTLVKEVNVDRIYGMMESLPVSDEYTYTADGTLNIKADAKATETEYNIGTADVNTDPGVGMLPPDYDPDAPVVDNAAISGYKTVNISGYTAKKDTENDVAININGNIKGGDRYKKNNEGSVEEWIDRTVSSGAITLSSNVNVDGDIEGFTTVKITDSSAKNINKMQDAVTVKSTFKKEYGDDIEIKTETFKKDGNFTASNATVGNVTNYKSVTLTNSSAGAISRDMLDKRETRIYWYDDSSFPGESAETYSAAGAFNAKLDKNADSTVEYIIGDITGYDNVTVTGYVDKRTPNNNITMQIGDIAGGKKTTSDMMGGNASVSGTVKLDMVNAGNISGYNTVTVSNAFVEGIVAVENVYENFYCGSFVESDKWSGTNSGETNNYSETVKSAASVTVNNDSIINTDIVGYQNVNITDSEVSLGVDCGAAYTLSYNRTTSYSDNEGPESEINVVNYTYNATKNSSITLKNATVGSIKGYNKVTATNSTLIGGAEQDMLVKITGKVNSKLEENSLVYEYKATGSFTFTVDRNADDYKEVNGDISGYEKVSISGYADTKNANNNKLAIVNGSIIGGKYNCKPESGMSDYTGNYEAIAGLDTTEMLKSDYSPFGNVTLTNTQMDGSIIGYDKITLTDSSCGSILSSYTAAARAVVYIPSGSSVSMSASSVDTIMGYKAVNVTKSMNEIAFYSCGDGVLTVAQGATLNLGEISAEKVNVNGTIVLTGTMLDAKFSGRGELAAASDVYEGVLEAVSGMKVLNLGATSQNFVSSVAELADDTAVKAVKWDGNSEYNGWLCGENGGDVIDTVDYVKFTAVEDGTIQISGDFDLADYVKVGRDTYEFDSEENMFAFDVQAGVSYTIGIHREAESSIAYGIEYLIA